jgi:hypothetical protein
MPGDVSPQRAGLVAPCRMDRRLSSHFAGADRPYLWREAVLRDPSGNRIKLYHAGENRLNPPWRVERRG